MSPGGYDAPSVPSSSTQHDVWRSSASLSSPYDRSYPSQTRHRSPSPQHTRRGYDSYVPPSRSAASHREDYPNYPNVYRPNVYRPDPSTYYSRTPSPDRYPAPRHSDASWDRTSPWSSSTKQLPSWQDRKPLPPSPTSTLPRDRGRRDSMLATRMFEPSDTWKQGHVDRSHRADVSKPPFISDRYSEYRSRDGKDAMSDRPPRNPYPGGDRYRPPQNYRDNYPPRSEYDSYRPQYDDNWSPDKSETLGSTDHGRRDSLSSSHGRSSGRYDAGRTSSSSALPPLPISPMRSPYRRYSRLSPDRGRRPVPYDDHLPYDSDSSSKGNNSTTNNTTSRVARKSRSRSRSSVASTHVSEQQSASISVKPHIPLSDSSVPVQVTNTSTVAEQKSKTNEQSHIEKSPVSVKKVLPRSPVIATIAPNEDQKPSTAVSDGTARSPHAPLSWPIAENGSGTFLFAVDKVLPDSLEAISRASSPISIPGLTITANEQASPLSPVPLERSVTEDTTPLSPTVRSSDQIVEPEKPNDDVLPSSSITPLESVVGASVAPGQSSRDSSIASSRVSSPPPTTVVTEEARPSSPVPELPPLPEPIEVPPAPASPKLPLPVRARVASPVPAVHEIPAKPDEPPAPSTEKPPTPSPPASKAPTPPKVVVTGPSVPRKSEVPSRSEAKTHAEALRSTVMTRLLNDRQPRDSRVDPVFIANWSINHRFLFEFKPGNEAAVVKQVEDLVDEMTTGKKHDDVMATFVNVKKALIQRFEERQEKIREKAALLKEEYLALHEKWKAHCAALDEQAKAAAAAEAAEHPQQNSGRTTRRSAANLGDAVRSDLEMEQIIASLGNDEATDPNQLSIKNLAVVPDMISVANGKVDYVFDDTSHLVHNPGEYYGTQTGLHDWTEQEKEVLMEKFAAYPKQFGNIAKFLPNKTASQCVNFYYLHKKKHVDFRKVVQQFAPNKRRRRRADKRKERGNGLLADIRQHDAEVHRDGTAMTPNRGSAGGSNSTNENGAVASTNTANTTPAPAVNGRPTRSRRQTSSNSTATVNGTAANTDANQGAEGRKPASRRTAIQLEGTPTSTPTPEPEQQQPQRPRRRRVPANTANKTAVQEEQVDDDPTDQDQRPAKRARRTRKVKSAAHVIDEPDGPLSTPQPPSVSSFPNSNTNDDIITTSTAKGTESTIANHDANNVGGSNLNSNASGPTTRRKVAPATVTWSDEDKKLFLTLLAQYGDDFKRIAASMPNKTTIQVQNYYKLNLVELDLERVAARAPKRSPTPEMANHSLGNYSLLLFDSRDHITEVPFHGSFPPPPPPPMARTLGSNSRMMDVVASAASLPHSPAQARSVHLPPAGHALSQPQSSIHHQLQQRPQAPQQQPYHQTQHTSQTHSLLPSSSLLHGSVNPPPGGATLPRLPELNRPLDLDPKLGSSGPWSSSSGGNPIHRSPPLNPVYESNHSGPSSRMHSPPGFGLPHGRSHMQSTPSTGPGPLASPPSYHASLTTHGASSQSHSLPPYSSHSAPRHGHVNVYSSSSSNAYDTSPSQSHSSNNYEPRGYPQRQPPPLSSLAPPVSSHHHQPQQQLQYAPSTHHQYPTPLPPPSGPRYHKAPFPEHSTPPPRTTSPPTLPPPGGLLAASGSNSNRRPGVMITKGENPYPVLHRPSTSGTTSPISNRVELRPLPQHPMHPQQSHSSQPHPYHHLPQTDNRSAVTSSPPFYRS